MEQLLEVDSLTVLDIVDNETDFLSTPASSEDGSVVYQSELRRAAQTQRLDFVDCCDAAHGLSLLLTARCGHEEKVLLFDAGPCPKLWQENAEKLGVDLASIDAVVLSHYHSDHSGGLSAALSLIARAREAAGLGPVRLDLHPARPEKRGVQTKLGVLELKPQLPSFQELRSIPNTELRLSAEPHGIGGCFFVSGAIPRRTSYERGLLGSLSCWDASGHWAPDLEIAEERYLAVKVKGCKVLEGAGVAVFSACSHGGIVNVCRHALEMAPGQPLLSAMGGLHLAGAGLEERVQATIHDLLALKPRAVLAGHCTGQFIPALAGAKYVFAAPAAAA